MKKANIVTAALPALLLMLCSCSAAGKNGADTAPNAENTDAQKAALAARGA